MSPSGVLALDSRLSALDFGCAFALNVPFGCSGFRPSTLGSRLWLRLCVKCSPRVFWLSTLDSLLSTLGSRLWLRLCVKKLGLKPEQLRQFSGHLQNVEEALSDPRAKRIHRKQSLGAEDADEHADQF